MFNEASIGLRYRIFNFELEENFSSEFPPLPHTRFFWMLLLLGVAICSGQKGAIFRFLCACIYGSNEKGHACSLRVRSVCFSGEKVLVQKEEQETLGGDWFPNVHIIHAIKLKINCDMPEELFEVTRWAPVFARNSIRSIHTWSSNNWVTLKRIKTFLFLRILLVQGDITFFIKVDT